MRKAFSFLMVGVLGFSVSFCGRKASEDSSVKNVFGDDHRVSVNSEKYPWSTIGKLSSGCTATLVSTYFILTASHCVFDKDGNLIKDLAFFPNTINNQAKTSATIVKVWFGAKITNGSTKNDWAFAQIDKPLSKTFGAMGIRTYPSYAAGTVNVAGYSADKFSNTAGVHLNCNIKDQRGGLLLHDCDMTRGASGGPMFILEKDLPFIVGINVGEMRPGEESMYYQYYADSVANYAVPSTEFFETSKTLYKND